jgi:hypothetical protein
MKIPHCPEDRGGPGGQVGGVAPFPHTTSLFFGWLYLACGFWSRVRAPIFFGSSTHPTGRCAPPPCLSQLRCFLFISLPPKKKYFQKQMLSFRPELWPSAICHLFGDWQRRMRLHRRERSKVSLRSKDLRFFTRYVKCLMKSL